MKHTNTTTTQPLKDIREEDGIAGSLDGKRTLNTPFANLPQFEKHTITLRSVPESTISTNTHDDEHIFSEAMEGVKTIIPKRKKCKKTNSEFFRYTKKDNNPQKLLEEAARNTCLNMTNLPI